jgi:chromosome segregation ATPase
MLQNQIAAADSKIAELSKDLSETLALLKDLKKGGRAYAAVLEDIDRLEDAVSGLEAQRTKLTGQLNQVALTSDKKQRLLDYAEKLGDGVEEAREDFNLRKALIDLLDVQVRLIREDGRAFANVSCVLQDIRLELSTTIYPRICPAPGKSFARQNQRNWIKPP